jgi:uncharacterized protein (TIRG00374 family)
VIVLVIRAVEWDAFATAVRSAKISWLVAAFVVFVLDRVLMAYKWALLLRLQGLRVRLWEAWSVYSAASLAGTVLPSTVGADMLRAAWAWRKGLGSGSAVATFVVERAIGFVVGSYLTVLGLLYLGAGGYMPAGLSSLRWIALVAWAGGTLLIALSFNTRFQRAVVQRIPVRPSSRLTSRLTRFRDAYTSFGARRKPIAAFALLTLAEQVVTLFMHYLVALALGLDVSPVAFVAACAIAFFVTRLPISLDGLGVLEGSLVVLLGASGVAAAPAVALALIARILAILSYGFGAFFSVFLKDARLTDLRRSVPPSGT